MAYIAIFGVIAAAGFALRRWWRAANELPVSRNEAVRRLVRGRAA
jgi:hypothetical protein